jgi:hypothetical protein
MKQHGDEIATHEPGLSHHLRYSILARSILLGTSATAVTVTQWEEVLTNTTVWDVLSSLGLMNKVHPTIRQKMSALLMDS